MMPAFSRRTVAELTEQIDDLVAQGVARLRAQGHGDLMATLAAPLPVMMISRILGLPESDVPQLTAWSDAAVEVLSGLITPAQMSELSLRLLEFMKYLGERIHDAHIRPTGCVLDTLAELDTNEAVSVAMQLVAAGSESTTSLIGSAARILAEDHALQQQLRGNLDQTEQFIEEVLRLESPFRGHYRITTRETQLGGVDLPQGARVMLLWSSANRDPNAFPAAEHLSLERPAIKSHLAFGRGIHFCLGAHLARLEAIRAINGLLASGPFQLAAEPSYIPSLLTRRLTSLDLSLA
jgi:cytochrome P450